MVSWVSEIFVTLKPFLFATYNIYQNIIIYHVIMPMKCITFFGGFHEQTITIGLNPIEIYSSNNKSTPQQN